MRWIILLTMTAWVLLAGNMTLAGTIFTWTDADGVKRYSNSQPPEDIDNVKTIEEVQYDPAGADSSRKGFDRMVEEAGKEADRHFDRQARKKARQAEERKRLKKEALENQAAEQRDRLMKEIRTIQNRALGPTFTKGMQDNLILQLQEKIDQLESGSDS